jgi:predicted DNA-binding protein
MASQNMVRKQYLMSSENISKVDRLAKKTGASSAQIVRLAVEAYDPDSDIGDPEETELMELVSSRLKEAISDTKKTRLKLESTLKKLETN